jgi:hypothetical protein
LATDVITATENWGKATTAFQVALKTAAMQRQQILNDLGADVTRPSGKVMSVEKAGQLFGPAGDPAARKRVSLKTGFGEGQLATIAKTAAGASYQVTEQAAERGVGGESGVVGASRVLVNESQDIEQQKAIEAASAAMNEANAGVAAAKAEQLQAEAAMKTSREEKVKKVGGVRRNARNQNRNTRRGGGR